MLEIVRGAAIVYGSAYFIFKHDGIHVGSEFGANIFHRIMIVLLWNFPFFNNTNQRMFGFREPHKKMCFCDAFDSYYFVHVINCKSFRNSFIYKITGNILLILNRFPEILNQIPYY